MKVLLVEMTQFVLDPEEAQLRVMSLWCSFSSKNRSCCLTKYHHYFSKPRRQNPSRPCDRRDLTWGRECAKESTTEMLSC